MSAGLIWIKKNKVKKDYSKWLGPEWKIENAQFEGASTYVMNHQSFFDIMSIFLFFNPTPGFIAKAEVKKWPAIGFISDVILESLFVDRAGTHDEKSRLVA
jgi:1-acyl-sn-glycerol-3-phosphate acyltransferase